jgi:dihydroxy-acid dehydratase
MREFIGQTEVGKMSEEDLLAVEQRALPTYGTCAMLGTANSMSFLSEILGLALPHSTTAPAVSSEKRRYAKQAGKRILGLIQENLTARKILTRKTLLNGIRAVMAMGASTNTVLHLMAIAHEAQTLP